MKFSVTLNLEQYSSLFETYRDYVHFKEWLNPLIGDATLLVIPGDMCCPHYHCISCSSILHVMPGYLTIAHQQYLMRLVSKLDEILAITGVRRTSFEGTIKASKNLEVGRYGVPTNLTYRLFYKPLIQLDEEIERDVFAVYQRFFDALESKTAHLITPDLNFNLTDRPSITEGLVSEFIAITDKEMEMDALTYQGRKWGADAAPKFERLEYPQRVALVQECMRATFSSKEKIKEGKRRIDAVLETLNTWGSTSEDQGITIEYEVDNDDSNKGLVDSLPLPLVQGTYF